MGQDFLAKTHLKASPALLGRPVLIEDDSRAMVELVTTKDKQQNLYLIGVTDIHVD
jgi:hypothetical protein